MEITAGTLDDLMHDVLTLLLEHNLNIEVTKGRLIGEFNGAVLRLTNPRARLSKTETRGKAFSALGELLWYLSKNNKLDFISYYIEMYNKFSDDQKTIYGGYGPRIFNLEGIDQFDNVTNILKRKPHSRQAVIQIFKGEDIVEIHSDVPCTCTLQFVIRDNCLNLIVYMRSNDAFLGLPHDVFSFTMLQEILACRLNLNMGEYVHMAGSLHLYEANKIDAVKYIEEGIQSSKAPMLPMPCENIDASIQELLNIEEKIRTTGKFDLKESNLDTYWKDLVRILLAFNYSKNNSAQNINKIKEIAASVNSVYKPYIEKKWRTMSGELMKKHE